MRLRLLTSVLLAFTATLAHGQASTYSLLNPNSTTTVVPVWSNSSGQIEALLLLEPSPSPPLANASNGRVISSFNKPLGDSSRFQGSFGTGNASHNSLGLFCNGSSGLLTSLDALASHCQLGSAPFGGPGTGLKAQAGLQRKNLRLDASAGVSSQSLGNARNPGLPTGFDTVGSFSQSSPGMQLNQQYLGLNSSLKLGSQGWVTIGGTLAKARLIPSSQLSGKLPTEWNSGSVSVGGGRGRIGGEVTGTVIDIPGQPEAFRSVGAGVTWQTPWRAKVSVGADNLMTRGKNPLNTASDGSKIDADNIDGAVPFVRYEQDL